MGVVSALHVTLRVLVPFTISFGLLSGCQVASGPSAALFAEHRETLNLGQTPDLLSPSEVEALNVSLALPTGWKALGLQKKALYTHEQWRSPSRRTAVGVTYIHLPLPLSTKTLVWFAMNEASKQTDGKIIRQWNDQLGRAWFEAENDKYHMTGYVMTRGFDAWINYCGYRVAEEKMPQELEIGGKSLDSVVPLSVMKHEESASAE